MYFLESFGTLSITNALMFFRTHQAVDSPQQQTIQSPLSMKGKKYNFFSADLVAISIIESVFIDDIHFILIINLESIASVPVPLFV